MIKRITALLFFALFLTIQISKAQTIISDSPDTICLGQLVTFTLTGSSGQCQKWHFTDYGTTVDGEDTVVSYTFNYTGQYSVEVTDHSGGSTNCSNPIGGPYSKDIYVVDTAAAYVNVYPLSTCPNSPISFNMPYNLAGYHWDFGDGTTSTEQSPTHEFSLPVGTKTIQAIFFRPCGNDTVYRYIDITDTLKPITYSSDFYLYNSNDSVLCPNTPLQFYFNGAYNTDYSDFRIYFGDGDSSANQNVYHSYTDTGYFYPTVVVWNGCGNTDTIEFNNYYGIVAIHVTNGLAVSPSLYSGNLSVVYPNTYLECPFTSIKCTLNNSPFPIERYSYYWNFGDGGTSSQKDPAHSYAATGPYSPTLTVTNGCGNSSSGVFPIPIEIRDTLTPSLFGGDAYHSESAPICSGSSVNFYYNTSNHPQYTWKWYFGDGDSSTLANPVHVYTSALANETFNPFIRVFNGCGKYFDYTTMNPIFISSSLPISPTLPIYIYTSTLVNDTVCIDDPVVLYLDYPSGTPMTFDWDFGDGGTADSAISVTHYYALPGTYTVSVAVENLCGTRDTIYYPYPITVVNSGGPPPAAGSFYYDPAFSCDDTISFSTQFNFFKYYWNFDDGDTSTSAAPNHFYQSANIYYPMLMVENRCGQTSHQIPNQPYAQKYDTYAADAGDDVIKISGGASVILTGSVNSGYLSSCTWTYGWSPATGLDDPNSRRPVASPSVTTTYYLNPVLTGFACTNPGCVTGDSVTVIVQNSLGGMIYRNNYNDTVKAGRVFLIQYDPTNNVLMPTVGTATINANGSYSFGYVDQGDYYLLADASTSMYPDAALTYYGDTVDWSAAHVFSHMADSNSVNINVKEYTPPASGIGRIAGIVMEGQNYGKMMSAGQPVKGISVGLNKSPDGVVQMTTSDTTSGPNEGKFEFDNLAPGFYKLFANVTGVPLDLSFPTTTFTISVTDSTDLNVGIYVDSNLISLNANIYASVPSLKTDGQEILVSKVYPNPASDHLDIEIDNYTQNKTRGNEISFHFYDIRGKKIESLNPLELQRGHSVIRINTSGLMNGIYMLGIEQTDDEGRNFVNIVSKVVIVK